MIQRICPICDQTMKHPHYCRNCKSWVRHPYVRDVTYYLNERHPQKETTCTYHNSPTHATPTSVPKPAFHPPRAATPQSTPPPRPPIRPTPASHPNATAGWVLQNGDKPDWTIPPSTPAPTHPQDTSQTGQQQNSFKVFWAAAVIVIIIITASIISTSLKLIRKQISLSPITDQEIYYDEETESWGPEWWDGGDWNGEDWDDEDIWDWDDDWESDWDDDDIQILEDEEVIQEGVACNGSGHFNISGAEMEEFAKEILRHYGYEIGEDQIYKSSYNTRYPSYDGEIPYTNYSSYISIIIREAEDKEDLEEYLTFDCDTATGQLHGIHLWIEDRETMLSLSTELLELIEKQSKMPEGIWSFSVKRDMPRVIDIGDGYSLNAGNVSIQGYRYQEGYWFGVSLLGELEESESRT